MEAHRPIHALTGAIPIVSSAIPEPAPRETASRPAVVALGGGHGLSASLAALRLVTDRICAVVTVADDGGSSGRLRDEFGALPPGDLRMALSALCDDSEWGRTWRDVLQYRFDTHGPLDHHAVGNLLIVALWELLGDNVAGLDWVARLLGARGRVLPMAQEPLHIEAHVEQNGVSRLVRGQAAVARAEGRITHVRLEPADPAVPADVLTAVAEADWVFLGPGSWYSSVLPHVLVPQLRDALTNTPARRCLILNLGRSDEEMAGLSPEDHLQVLASHAPDLRFDAIVIDPQEVEDEEGLRRATANLGAELLIRDVRRSDGTPRHENLRLAAALQDVFDLPVGSAR